MENWSRELKRTVSWASIGLSILLSAAAMQLSGPALAADASDPRSPEAAAAVALAESKVPTNPLRDAYFGEQHIHTAYSLDAYIGGTRITPDMAYRWAKGETMTVNGQDVTLRRPLDFAAITDHAEFLGEMYSTLVAGAPGHDQQSLKDLRGLTDIDERESWFLKYVVENTRGGNPEHPPFFAGPDTTKSAWTIEIEAAAKNYEPGTFTTIPAFEWSSAPKGGNLHRNVFFRDMNVPELPMSSIDIPREDVLWKWMQGLEDRGMQVFAIPHNSNASKGMMFDPNTPQNAPIDANYAAMRAKYEPLIEIMQIKGNSEVQRSFWQADEFAGFENADSIANYSGRVPMKENYVRYGLIKGLEYQGKLGVNPYKYGIVGGTDSHNGTPGNTAEDNFAAGSHGAADGTIERRRDSDVGGWIAGKDLNTGALTGVWATSNTRGAIWDAMKAKETFGTSGTRLKLRMFAGFDLDPPGADAGKMVESGYKQGVPMGGTLGPAQAGTGKPLRFNVWAIMDPDNANLDRIQIIKGWIDEKGAAQEKIIDVVWSGERKQGADGKLPPVGDTVDVTTAKWTNTIGSPELTGTWVDTAFDPKQNALYYARVLQIPTPRWSTYDAVRANLPLLADEPATVQERAWSSPIWYTP